MTTSERAYLIVAQTLKNKSSNSVRDQSSKVLFSVKATDAKGVEHVRCEVKQTSDSSGLIRIEGGIDWYQNNSTNFRAAIEQLKNAGIGRLDLYLNSPGGSVYEAGEIENILNSWTGEKYLTIGALCCSAATNLILPFPKKNVKAHSNVTAMMHNPTTSISDAEEKDLLSSAKLLANTKKAYIKRMSARMGMTETQLSNKLDGTWWLTYDDLVAYNLVGGKVETESPIPSDATNVFNKYRFENVPDVLNIKIKSSNKEVVIRHLELSSYKGTPQLFTDTKGRKYYAGQSRTQEQILQDAIKKRKDAAQE